MSLAVVSNDDDGSAQADTVASPSAVDELRSHMPEGLRSQSECKQVNAASPATAVIECTWPSSNIPSGARYASFADTDSMNAAAEQMHKRQAQAQSCQSADDFTAGGQEAWESTNGQGRGTAWCYLNENKQPVVLWTDDTLHIMASAAAPALDNWQTLLDWFKTAGPE